LYSLHPFISFLAFIAFISFIASSLQPLQYFNASTLQRFNTPTLQHSNTPTLQRFHASTLQHSNAPTLHRSIASTLQRSIAPTLARLHFRHFTRKELLFAYVLQYPPRVHTLLHFPMQYGRSNPDFVPKTTTSVPRELRRLHRCMFLDYRGRNPSTKIDLAITEKIAHEKKASVSICLH
jgi:hypothetical protein